MNIDQLEYIFNLKETQNITQTAKKILYFSASSIEISDLFRKRVKCNIIDSFQSRSPFYRSRRNLL